MSKIIRKKDIDHKALIINFISYINEKQIFDFMTGIMITSNTHMEFNYKSKQLAGILFFS